MPNDLTLVPATVADPKPDLAVKPELPAELVSDAEADAAAKTLGMTFFNASKARKLKLIGAYQVQQGVVQLGVGRLAAADEALTRMLEVAVTLATDDKIDEQPRINALLAGKGLVEALQKSVQLMVELQTEKLIGGPSVQRKRSFVDEQPVVPINAHPGSTVNVNVDSNAKGGQS